MLPVMLWRLIASEQREALQDDPDIASPAGGGQTRVLNDLPKRQRLPTSRARVARNIPGRPRPHYFSSISQNFTDTVNTRDCSEAPCALFRRRFRHHPVAERYSPARCRIPARGVRWRFLPRPVYRTDPFTIRFLSFYLNTPQAIRSPLLPEGSVFWSSIDL